MKADEAARQDLGDLGQAFVGSHVVGVEGRHRYQSRYGLRTRSV
jgi:hypothetical protein